MSTTYQDVPVKKIKIPKEFKRSINRGADDLLINSINNEGVKTPIYVLSTGGEYYLVDGLRRVRCCKQLTLAKIPAIVEKYTGKDPLGHASYLRLMLDTQRQDLLPSQRAYYINLLMTKYGISLADIADAYGTTEQTMKKWLSVADCAQEIRMLIDNKKFPLSATRLIHKLSKKGQMALIRHFMGRTRVSVDDIRNWIERLDDSDASYLKNPKRSQTAIRRHKVKRIFETFKESKAIGESITDIEERISEITAEVDTMKEAVRYARPVVARILTNKDTREGLPKAIRRDFEIFAQEEGIL